MLFLLCKVFPPAFRELPPPPLELFDLDETFSSEKARLAEITNKCKWSRLIVYMEEIVVRFKIQASFVKIHCSQPAPRNWKALEIGNVASCTMTFYFVCYVTFYYVSACSFLYHA